MLIDFLDGPKGEHMGQSELLLIRNCGISLGNIWAAMALFRGHQNRRRTDIKGNSGDESDSDVEESRGWYMRPLFQESRTLILHAKSAGSAGIWAKNPASLTEVRYSSPWACLIDRILPVFCILKAFVVQALASSETVNFVTWPTNHQPLSRPYRSYLPDRRETQRARRRSLHSYHDAICQPPIPTSSAPAAVGHILAVVPLCLL